MPAPDGTLLAAIRAATVARHVFFRLAHSQGVVLAWDGIGEFVFSAETYLGVAGFISMAGVSNSGDIQNHAVEVRLNAVPQTAMRDIDPSIKDDAAKIWLVWIDEAGAVIGSKLIFEGSGNVLSLQSGASEIALIARLKAPVIDWSFVPRMYYSGIDQKALFAGDTGCDQTDFLQAATIAGWQSPLARVPYWQWDNPDQGTVSPRGADFVVEPATSRVIGNHTHGLSICQDATSKLINAAATQYRDMTTNASIELIQPGGYMLVGGQVCTVDTAGDVRTPNGNYVTPADNMTSGFRLRRSAEIASAGTATATQIQSATVGINGKTHFRPTSGTMSGANASGLVYEEGNPGLPFNTGVSVIVIGGKDLRTVANSSTGLGYKEEGTDWPCVCNATDGRLWCWNQAGLALGGVCVLSTTKAILGPNGGRIIPTTGGSNFLRIWT